MINRWMIALLCAALGCGDSLSERADGGTVPDDTDAASSQDSGAKQDAGTSQDAALADAGADASSADWSRIDAVVARHLALFGGGCAISILKGTAPVFRKGYGFLATDLDRVVDLASSSKWISAAVLMTEVDAGRLSLDQTFSEIDPSLAGTAAANVTLRQAFSHTGGMRSAVSGNHRDHGRIDYLRDPRITLEESADFVSDKDLVAAPASALIYGGASMQVAGRMVEVSAAQPFADIFDSRIALPLGMTQTRYDAHGSPTSNPHIGGGITSRMSDIERFVAMIMNYGTLDGVRVLSREAIETMEADQTSSVPIQYSPYEADDVDPLLGDSRYGIGVWRLATSADPDLQLISHGASGVFFLVHRPAEYGLVFVADTDISATEMLPGFVDLIAEVRLVMEPLR